MLRFVRLLTAGLPLVLIPSLFLSVAVSAKDLDIQEQFDTLGPAVHTLKLKNGKAVAYIDEGEKTWPAVVFFGGSGTSVRIFAITEFLRRLRRQLKLRFISVERDGFGQTALTKGWSYADYAAEIEEVLGHLGVGKFALVGISGGGPYLTATAARMPGRVRSIHLLAAFSQYDPANKATSGLCGLPQAKRDGYAAHFAANPRVWWNLGKNTSTHRIPGFADAAFNDGARTFSLRGQKGDAKALIAEFNRFCTLKLPSAQAVKAPVFIYQGMADTTVRPVHMKFWKGHFPNVVKLRQYKGEGHDIQYRHWDQVLIDVAGRSSKLVMCVNGKSTLVAESEAPARQAAGAALGICAWQKK